MACITLECCPESLFTYQSADISLTSGLLAYWQFEEAADENRVDATGNGSDLVPTNNPARVDGKIDFGTEFVFGNSEVLTCASNSFLTVGSEFTFAGWVNLSSYAGGFIFKKADGGADEIALVVAPLTGTSVFAFYLFNSLTSELTTLYATSAPNPALDAWHFIAVWLEDGICKIQVDNGVVDSVAMATPSSLGDFTMGTALDGKLDEWGKWSRALTQAERTFLFNYSNGKTYPFTS